MATYTGTATYARFDLLEHQIRTLLREAGNASKDSLEKVSKGLQDPHYIEQVAVRGVYADGKLGAEIRLIINWRTFQIAIQAGGDCIQVPQNWDNGLAPSVDEGMRTFLIACEQQNLWTEWVVHYGSQWDRDEVNRFLGFQRAENREWKSKAGSIRHTLPILSEASVVITLADF